MAYPIYGAVRSDRTQSTYAGNLKSVKFATTPTALENGSVFFADALVAGEREVYSVVKPVTADLATRNLVILDTPPVSYEAGKTAVNFILEAGQVGRARVPSVGDVFTVTDSVISGTSVVGEYLIPANDSWELTASASIGSTKFSAKVIEKTTLYGQAATAFEVVKA